MDETINNNHKSTTLDSKMGKIAGWGGVILGLGLILLVLGLVFRVVTTSWSFFYIGIVIFGIGIMTYLIPWIHLYFVSLKMENYLRKHLPPEVGREVPWTDVVRQVFRVLEFDKSDTTIDQNYQVIAKSRNRPYGYLIVESPILDSKVRLPIIHRDDFLLASSVFDDPKFSGIVLSEELLVTYAPKNVLPDGLSGSPHRVLHYLFAPSGTLDNYYSSNNEDDIDPQKLFGSFIYEGEIHVLNPYNLK